MLSGRDRQVDDFAADLHCRVGSEKLVWNGVTVFRFHRLGDFGTLMLTSRMFCFLFLWIALLTRLDIANAVRAAARYCCAPELIH